VVKDITLANDTDISDETVRNYLYVCNQMYLTINLHVWNTHTRSSKSLRKKPKIYFLDPSIAVSSLGLNQNKLLHDFENLEINFIIEFPDET
jgi:predicted AAA+ superfamily ATPase